ncbi:type VII secretion target [Nocardia sp. NPDC058633]|uniref:type VII secretion target n=1 Tax=Nocardia sp. NPDC058633 TaxID=3346568 RepID=UPI0036663283
MSLKVDPDALRAWAGWLDGLSDDVEALQNTATMTNTASFGAVGVFPGTDIGAALTSAQTAVKGALGTFATRPAEMATIARGAGDNYEITDVQFAAGLQAMGGVS